MRERRGGGGALPGRLLAWRLWRPPQKTKKWLGCLGGSTFAVNPRGSDTEKQCVDLLAQWGFRLGVERGPGCICPDGPACPCIHTDAEGYENRRLFQRPGPRLLAAPADEEVCPVCGWGGGRGAGTCELIGVWPFVSVNEWEGVWRREGEGGVI